MLVGYLGLGANVGDPRAQLEAAVQELFARAVRVTASSSVYETDPVGAILDQPPFLNACVKIETGLEPIELLRTAKAIEAEMGRDFGAPRDSPRPIDIDVLLLGSTQVAEDQLAVPHPRMLERRFVLIPLLELDLTLRTPGGDRLADALAVLDVTDGVRRHGPKLTLPTGPLRGAR